MRSEPPAGASSRQLAAWTCERKPVDGMHALQARGIPAGVLAHPAHPLGDPHLAERGYVRVLEQTHPICRERLGLSEIELDALIQEGVLEEKLALES